MHVVEQEEPVTDAPSTAADGLNPDDLIDDRALTTADDDEFRLLDVVDEVAQLCDTVPVPATVAVYGSWGSGKSSLANLLRAKFIRRRRRFRIGERKPKVAFAVFDAFKYAENPLRRQFISQLAQHFGVGSKEFSQGLYTSTRDFGLKITPRKWLALFAVLLISALVAFAVVALIAAIYAVVAKGPFRPDFTRALRAGIPGIALAAPLLAAAIGLLGSSFKAETTVEAPSSDEEFERLFRKLVRRVKKKRRCDRIVIFIDELDRCSPGEVVSTLETLRTFLEITPCIFIVAADQQALERALTDSARQTTPFNPANPYYSAGSAYLDKIFQYQLPLPPILSRRLSRFALRLIEKRSGVWAQVPNRAELVSVLVPTHVSSPRRVKALLNSFALLFRLALTRSQEGVIDEGVAGRASEVAKLSCLRTEFPLFAADLSLDRRLPEIVLRLHRAPALTDDELQSEFVGAAPEALMRARKYAREELPVDEVIADRPRTAPAQTKHQDERTEGEEEAAASTIEQEEAEGVAVERSHARQLIRYLQKTEAIPGPRRDLVYLESSGAAFGLDPELAEQLEEDAVDARLPQVAEAFSELDETGQQNALRLLARLIVEAEAVGIEAANVTQSIFAALKVHATELAPVAEDLLNAVVTHNRGYTLNPDDLAGALALSLADDGEAAKQMRGVVLARDEIFDDEELTEVVLRNADALWVAAQRVADVFTEGLASNPGLVTEALADVPDQRVIEMIGAADFTEEDAEEEEPTAAEEDGAAEGGAIEGLTAFVEAMLSRGRKAVADAGFAKLLSLDEDAAGDAVTPLIPSFAPITDPAHARTFFERVQRRPVGEWASWLEALDAGAVASLTGGTKAVTDYTHLLWRRRFNPADGTEAADEEEFAAVASELGRLRAATGPASDEQSDILDGAAVTSAGEIPAREERFAALGALEEAGALDQAVASASILSDLEQTLRSTAASATPQPLSQYVLEHATVALQGAEVDAATEFLEAVEESGWIDATTQEILRVRCALAQRAHIGKEALSPKDETLETLLAAGEEEADRAVGEWLTGFEPGPLEAVRILAPRIADGARLGPPLRTAVEQAALQWTPKQKADLLAELAPRFVSGDIDESTIRAVALSDADAARATDILIERYEAATNKSERTAVMRLWDEVNPAPDHLRRRLITDIYIPLVELGKGGANIALTHFDLVRQPPSQALQDRVKKAIRAVAEGDKNLSKRAEKRLQDAGWVSKKRRWLKRPF